MLGFGVSAIGQLAGGYAQNRRTVGDYATAIDGDGLATCRGILLSADDELRRDVIGRLMCHFRVDKAAVEERFGIDFDRPLATRWRGWHRLPTTAWCGSRPTASRCTALGRLLVRNVAMAFDAYLSRPGQRFSRTV